MNFSNWGSEKHTANQLAEVCDAVSDGSMPLRGYSVLHPSARLSQEDVKLICEWSRNSVAQVTSAKQQASARTGAR